MLTPCRLPSFGRLLILATLAAACGGEGGAAPSQEIVVTITGGAGQTAVAGAVLATPLAVRVTTTGGAPVAGRSVVWAFVGTPAGLLQAPATVTNADGRTENIVTLGPTPGTYTIQASAVGATSPVAFTATATATTPPPGNAVPTLVAEVPVPANYGIHDTFVRDGIAFVCAWNTGVRIYDVGGGNAGGSPQNPVLLSTFVTNDNGVAGGAQVHNAWWFHNPVTGQKRYLFIGQEGPGVVGSNASGDLHVVDVSNLAAPVEVASLRVAGAGVHNFWMDEARQVLYAAWYNAGVVAIDVSGTLTGNLANRIIAQVQPGGPGNTYVWGVMQVGSTLFASDMRSGFWALDPLTLAVRGGGNNVPERFGSDLWVRDNVAYTGTWGNRGGVRGNTIKVWTLGAGGVPTLAREVVVPDVGTISDVAVTPDGKALVVTAEGLSAAGLYIYDRAVPTAPVLRAQVGVSQGLHTGEVAVINGRTYVFAARNPGNPALLIYDITGVVP